VTTLAQNWWLLLVLLLALFVGVVLWYGRDRGGE
jgi:hypothetical protein